MLLANILLFCQLFCILITLIKYCILTEVSFSYTGKLVAKIARKDYLAMKLAQRPERQDLINKNIIHLQSEQERQDLWETVGNQLIRYDFSIIFVN